MEDSIRKNQTVIIKDRKHLEIDGVINVEGFNDDYLEIMSTHGGIEVEGNGLKIEELRQDTGKILISGEICGLFYRPEKTAKLFSRKGK